MVLILNVRAETIEGICAVVNQEIITYSELKYAKNQYLKEMYQAYKGDELDKKIKNADETVFNTLLENKILLSVAKSKNYDVDADVDLMIKELKKRNNFASDEDLKKALNEAGISYGDFRKQQKMQRMQQRYVYEEVYSKITINNTQIMDYYKKNKEKYTKPATIKLNAIYLKKGDEAQKVDNIKLRVDEELKSADFISVAKKFSQLSDSSDESKYVLGEFKMGELDSVLEKAAKELKEGKYSAWLETEQGWYRLQLVKFVKESPVEYKEVRDSIAEVLTLEARKKGFQDLIEKLKKESYIKIYKKHT